MVPRRPGWIPGKAAHAAADDIAMARPNRSRRAVPPRRAAGPINVVVDLSHHNGDVDFEAVAGDGVLGVIHKATQGTGYADPLFVEHRGGALEAGLHWGAYHFGTGEDPVAQAEHFLDVVQPGPDVLLALDFEANLQGPSMTLDQARAFVTHVQAETGRWPGLYSGHYVKELLGAQTDPVLANCWFWLAQYGPTPVVPPTWAYWTLWQYTDGGLGPPPHEVAGIGRCDRDRFNGTQAQLARFWPFAP